MIDKLQEIGLSKNESKVYLALLKNGSTTTGPLIKTSGLYRVIVYDTLEKLIQLGLVKYTIRKNIKYFEAENPEKIVELIKNKELLAQSVAKKLNQIRVEKPINHGAFVYEGWKGIKSAQENYLKEMKQGTGEYLMIGASRTLHKKLQLLFCVSLKLIMRKLLFEVT